MEFRLLTLAEKPLVDAALGKYPPEISELTFTNLFCLMAKRQVLVAEHEGGLVFLAKEGERSFFLPPVCMCDVKDAARAMFEHAQAAGFEPAIERVPEPMAMDLAQAGFKVEEDRANWDYVYRVPDLALLEGRHFDGKRNFIRQALASHRCEYRRITAGNVSDCLALETSWCNLRHCELDPGLEAEQRAIAVCFENWERFSLIGGAVVVDGRIQAFAIGERLNPTTAVVHFEKANPELRGMYQLINHWFSQNELSEFAYVNREQDLGIEGLRKAKESYHPHRMVRKFTIRP
jgi:uncharacterized protein